MRNRSKNSGKIYQEIRTINTKVIRIYGLSKDNKTFEKVPSFGLIIDTTGFTHDDVGKNIKKILTLSLKTSTYRKTFLVQLKI